MSGLPKLRVTTTQDSEVKIIDLEQAGHIFSNPGADMVVVVEKQMVNSYEELVQLASQEKYRDKEYLELTVISPVWIAGG